MYKIQIYSLEECPYSMKAEELLIKYNNTEVIKVKRINKEKVKKKNKMNTFPQIFFVKDNKKIKIGGCDKITEILEIINNNRDIKIIIKKLNLKNWTKKQKLRLIELFVQNN